MREMSVAVGVGSPQSQGRGALAARRRRARIASIRIRFCSGVQERGVAKTQKCEQTLLIWSVRRKVVRSEDLT